MAISFNLFTNMDLSTSWARETASGAAAFLAAKSIAVSVVMSHRGDEIDADSALELSAARRPAPDSDTPRRVKLCRSFTHARANRLRTVPAGHLSRCAASSSVSPSK